MHFKIIPSCSAHHAAHFSTLIISMGQQLPNLSRKNAFLSHKIGNLELLYSFFPDVLQQ